MNGTGDSTNIVTIDASDEDAEPRAEACRSFDISRALLHVVLILKLLVRGTLRLRFIIVIGGDEP